jgi:cytoskeleton protein RodZ
MSDNKQGTAPAATNSDDFVAIDTMSRFPSDIYAAKPEVAVEAAVDSLATSAGTDSLLEATTQAFPEIDPTVGDLLRAAREAKGWDCMRIAQFLRLSERQVQAMEFNDWPSLPGNTMIRGFVRNYARLVQIDSAPLMALLDKEIKPVNPAVALPLSLPETAPTDLISTHNRIGASPRDKLVIGGGIGVLAVAVLVATLLPSDWQARLSAIELPSLSFGSSAPAAPATPAPAPVAAAGTAAPAVLVPPPSEPVFPPGGMPTGGMAGMEGMAGMTAPAAPITPAVPETPAATPAPATPAPVAATAAATPAAVAGNAQLQLVFEGDSWVTVRGKEGKTLVSQLNKAGSTLNVEGEGPYNLTIGNAALVTLRYKQQVVDLKAATKGATARLKLD